MQTALNKSQAAPLAARAGSRRPMIARAAVQTVETVQTGFQAPTVVTPRPPVCWNAHKHTLGAPSMLT